MVPAIGGFQPITLEVALANVLNPDDAARAHATQGITALKANPAMLAAGLIYVSREREGGVSPSQAC